MMRSIDSKVGMVSHGGGGGSGGGRGPLNTVIKCVFFFNPAGLSIPLKISMNEMII